MKKNGSHQFALCVNNEDYPASLEVGKVYRIVQDDEASKEGLMRVVDESGEDYAFARNRFHILELPPAVRKSLLPQMESA